MSATSSSSSSSETDWLTTVQHRRRNAGWIAGGTVVGVLGLMAPFVVSRSPLPYMVTPPHKVRRALQFIQQQQRQLNIAKRGCYRVFVDFGSGDGSAVQQALMIRAGHDAADDSNKPYYYYHRSIGIELNYTLFAIAQVKRLLFWSRDFQQRSSFYCQDMFQYPILNTLSLLPPPAETVGSGESDDYLPITTSVTAMIFGVTPLMVPISQKLALECPPGTMILSYRFHLPTAATAAVEDKADAQTQKHGEKVEEVHTELSPDQQYRRQGLVNADLVYEHEEMRIYQVKATE